MPKNRYRCETCGTFSPNMPSGYGCIKCRPFVKCAAYKCMETFKRYGKRSFCAIHMKKKNYERNNLSVWE